MRLRFARPRAIAGSARWADLQSTVCLAPEHSSCSSASFCGAGVCARSAFAPVFEERWRVSMGLMDSRAVDSRAESSDLDLAGPPGSQTALPESPRVPGMARKIAGRNMRPIRQPSAAERLRQECLPAKTRPESCFHPESSLRKRTQSYAFRIACATQIGVAQSNSSVCLWSHPEGPRLHQRTEESPKQSLA